MENKKPKKQRKIPLRKCLGCQEMKPKREMIRIVRTAEGEVTIDFTGKKSGRGTYICPNEQCLENGLKEKRLSKALAIDISVEMIENLKRELKGNE